MPNTGFFHGLQLETQNIYLIVNLSFDCAYYDWWGQKLGYLV